MEVLGFACTFIALVIKLVRGLTPFLFSASVTSGFPVNPAVKLVLQTERVNHGTNFHYYFDGRDINGGILSADGPSGPFDNVVRGNNNLSLDVSVPKPSLTPSDTAHVGKPSKARIK